MPNTPKKVETTSSLERMYWMAGILTAIVAVGSMMWSVWTYFKPSGEMPQVPLTSAVNSGSGGIIIQGSDNRVVAPQSVSTETHVARRFVDIAISDRMLDLHGKMRHEAHFPQISGKIPPDILDRVNFFLKRTALTEYERYSHWDEVRISYEIGLKEFNLLGVDYEIFAGNDQAAHPITSTSAITLDLETGSAFTLNDLFRAGHVGKLNELVRAELIQRDRYYPCGEGRRLDVETEKVMEAIENGLEMNLGHPADICFKSVSSNTQYYLTDTSVVLVFPKYSIAPGADGDIEVPINFSELRDILSPSGPLQRFL